MNEKYMTVKELPESERPYEKCEKYGAKVLSDAELLAVIIKSGCKNERSVELASRVLNILPEKGINELHHISMQELRRIKGIGRVKSIQLVCIAELAKRMWHNGNGRSMIFDSADIIADYYMEEMRHLEKEQLRVIYLDSKLKYISDCIMFVGSVGMSIMEPREILIEALGRRAVNLIIMHNHPSGDPTPSGADIASTRRLKEAAGIIGLKLADHIIIGDRKYVSLFDQNLI